MQIAKWCIRLIHRVGLERLRAEYHRMGSLRTLARRGKRRRRRGKTGMRGEVKGREIRGRRVRGREVRGREVRERG